MISIFRTSLTLAWSLWFGGMVSLFIFVVRLFKTSHDTGVAAAPVLFTAFATYQLIVGGIALLLVLALMFLSQRKSIAAIALACFAIAFGVAFPVHQWTKQANALREAGRMKSTEFEALHHRTSVAYHTAAVALLVGGVLISVTPVRKN